MAGRGRAWQGDEEGRGDLPGNFTSENWRQSSHVQPVRRVHDADMRLDLTRA